MNEYTITFAEDMDGSVLVLSQEDVDSLLDRYALPSAVRDAERGGSERTAILGYLEITKGDQALWHETVLDPQVFTDMLSDAMVMAVLEQARHINGSSEQESSADN